MLKKYSIFLPKVEGGVMEEWRQCLEQIINFRLSSNRLVKLNIFTEMADYDTYLKVSQEIGKSISEAFGDQCPAFNITVHPPERPWKVAVEAGYMNTDSSEIISSVWNPVPYVVITSQSGKEVWAGGLGAGLFPDDTRRAAGAAFEQIRAILDAEDMSFNHLVRQWNYVGNILEVKNGFQNYQIFNEVRSELYHKYRTIPGYPAATGVGVKHGGVIFDFCAVKPGKSIRISAVDNPDQIKPYTYGQQVLKGMPDGGKIKKQPPQFERAVIISDHFSSTLFVSGTASIIGQDTIGIGDVEKQTVLTIDNIKKLTDTKRLGQIIGDTDFDTMAFILLRVYIKNQDDFAIVKTICNERFPEVPALYIEADICRDDLLVEIEAEISLNN